MKKILIFMMMGIFLLSLTSGSIENLGSFKQNSNIELIQTCSDCTYNNISNVLYPNGTIAIGEALMEKTDTFYNLTFTNTTTLGTYTVNGFGDVGGIKTTWRYKFEVTPTGDSESLLGFFIIVYLILAGIVIFGFYVQSEWIAILGGLGLIFMGIFIMNTGIVIFRNDATQVIALVTIGLGAIIAIGTGMELINNNL